MEKFEGNFYISNERDLDEKTVVRNLDYHKKSNETDLAKARERAIPTEEALGRGSLEKINKVYGLVKEKFKERGIEHVSLPEVLFVKNLMVPVAANAVSRGAHIEVLNRNIENILLKQLMALILISHELYHSVGRRSYEVSNEKENGVTSEVRTHKVMGASHLQWVNKEKGHAELVGFEEGAAVQFQEEVYWEIKKLFPQDTIILYNQIVDEYEAYERKGKNRSLGRIIVSELYEDNARIQISHQAEYESSVRLVRYIASKIPNFYVLLEDARVNGKIVGLGKAIDTTFGSGWYRRIATATTDDSKQILKELKAIQVK